MVSKKKEKVKKKKIGCKSKKNGMKGKSWPKRCEKVTMKRKGLKGV